MRKKRKNSKRYEVKIAMLPEIENVKNYLNANHLTAISPTPYFFTHIELSNGDIITQDFNSIICSPMKLKKALKLT